MRRGSDDKILHPPGSHHPVDDQDRARRSDPINGSRRKRIAARRRRQEVSEVNKLPKMHRQMSDMMKKMGKGGAPMMRRHGR